MPKIDQISQAEYEQIAGEITSEDSPVGIDAKKTHIIIIHKLNEIERRLAKVEQQLRR